jgi:hypothetical protein
MQQTGKPASKWKVILMWVIFLGNIAFWSCFALWSHRNEPATPATENAPDAVRTIFMVVLGVISLIGGIGGYLLIIFTNCFTFKFTKPIWREMKAKVYFANIYVILAGALGIGLILSGFTSPKLEHMGLNPTMASMLPVLLIVAVVQIILLWVLVWSPLEKRLITKRLLAQGLTPAQIQNGTLVGLSDATRSSFKKFGAIEDDIGALWLGPGELVFWGDNERFSIRRDQVLALERKADAGSTSMLAGTTHPILHVRLPDGTERQIRLHCEGHGTRGKQRAAIDRLAAAIEQWHGSPVAVPA